MRKSKILVVGLIGLLFMFGLVLTSCGPKCDGGTRVPDCTSFAVTGGQGVSQTSESCGQSSCAVAIENKKPSGWSSVSCDCK
jgi:hypothetical protein